MKKKGFTLVELLVVIAIIALLMGILMPALARVRMIAYRMVCGTNLAGIGKAIMLYAGDTKESYPMTGCSNSARWAQKGEIAKWYGPTVTDAFNCIDSNPNSEGTIGSIFYLLVKYEDTSVKQFNCKGDVGVRIFKLTDFPVPIQGGIEDFTKAFDFGRSPGLYCSYSYQQPFYPNAAADGVQYQINANSPPSAPLAADRNPMMDSNVNYINPSTGAPGGAATADTEKTPFQTWEENKNSYVDKDNVYNSFAHQREGQNVLFNDGHIGFSKTANVGIDNDNIWQKWITPPGNTQPKPKKKEREVGGLFATTARSTTNNANTTVNAFNTIAEIVPKGNSDALLVNEHHNAGVWPK